jgi:hypothetical protein
MMKKTIFLLTCILFSLSAFAQRIALNKSVVMDIPKNLNKISREQALAHAKEKFKGDKMISGFYSDMDTTNGHLYQIDDIITQDRDPSNDRRMPSFATQI